MKKTLGVLLGITAVAVAGLVIYKLRNKTSDTCERLSQVSDEGYETAHDVLFPKDQGRGKNLRFGPILPQ